MSVGISPSSLIVGRQGKYFRARCSILSGQARRCSVVYSPDASPYASGEPFNHPRLWSSVRTSARCRASAATNGDTLTFAPLLAVAAVHGSNLDQNKLGYGLRAHKDRIVVGRRFVSAGQNRDKVALWRLEQRDRS
jgi:hypothetical protein